MSERAVAALAVAALLSGAAPTPPAPPAPPPSGMAGRLAELAARSNPERNVILNHERAERLRRRLAAASDPEERFELRMKLGYELLLAGGTEEAMELLDALREEVRARQGDEGAEAERKLTELLGVAALRLGEQENCLARHNADSCLMPLAGGGLHGESRGARRAVEEYTALAELDPDNLEYRWLLNLAVMTLGRYPAGVPSRWRIPEEVFASEYDLARFTDVAPEAGLDTVSLSGGAVVDDFDGDGYLDVVVSSWGPRDPLRFFHNRRDGTFEERSEEAGLGGQTGGLNLVHADYDNDGALDLLVLRGAWLGFFNEGNWPNSLLRNRGDGSFEDVTERAGVLSLLPTQTAAWGDYDGDGWLDLFIGNESVGPQRHPCQLYENQGDGTFREVAAEVGVDVVGLVKGVAWGDYDNDGRPDLYLSRLGQPNLLLHNDGPVDGDAQPAGAEGEGAGPRWRFSDVTERAGVAEPRWSFPVWFFDYDNDGWQDLFVAPFLGFAARSLETIAASYLGLPEKGERPRLYRNRGDGSFEDVTAAVALDHPFLAMGANFGDLDNDGWLDFYLGTGEPNLASLIPNRMFRNAGGERFQDVTTAGGFGHLQKGHGVAFADLDNDGDQDVFEELGGAFTGDVYQNVLFENPGFGKRWLTLRLTGTASNRSAVGARIRVLVREEGGRREIHRTVGSGGSFGASSLQEEVGLGDALGVDRIEVRWPGSGRVEVFEEVELDRIYGVREGTGRLEPVLLQRLRLGGGNAPGHAR